MANDSASLSAATHNKKDEFYTTLQVVEDEMKHYRKQLEGKSVLCN